MVLLLFRREEVSFLFSLPHIVVYTTCCFPLLWIILFKRISLALQKLGGREGKKLGKIKYRHFHRSVKWVPSAHTVQMTPHNSFEDTEILTAIISPRVLPRGTSQPQPCCDPVAPDHSQKETIYLLMAVNHLQREKKKIKFTSYHKRTSFCLFRTAR